MVGPSHIECARILKPLCANLLCCTGLRKICLHYKKFMLQNFVQFCRRPLFHCFYLLVVTPTSPEQWVLVQFPLWTGLFGHVFLYVVNPVQGNKCVWSFCGFTVRYIKEIILNLFDHNQNTLPHANFQIHRSHTLAPQVPRDLSQLWVTGALFHRGVPKKYSYKAFIGGQTSPKSTSSNITYAQTGSLAKVHHRFSVGIHIHSEEEKGDAFLNLLSHLNHESFFASLGAPGPTVLQPQLFLFQGSPCPSWTSGYGDGWASNWQKVGKAAPGFEPRISCMRVRSRKHYATEATPKPWIIFELENYKLPF